MAPPTPPGSARLRDLLGQAVAAGILTAPQAAAVAALEERRPARRGAVLAEALGYVGGALAVGAALFLGAELWGELGPWPRVLLLAAVALAGLLGGAALGGRAGPAGRLGGFLWVVAVVAVAATAGVGVDGLLDTDPATPGLVAAYVALLVAALLWWARPAVLQHVATFAAAVATLLTVTDHLDADAAWGGPLLWGLGLVWLALSAFPAARDPRGHGGVWRPAEPGWVLGALAAVTGPLFADTGRAAWLVVGVATGAALVAVGVRARRPWVVAVGTGGMFLAVPLAVAELFDARLGPLLGLLGVGLALVMAAVVLTRRTAR